VRVEDGSSFEFVLNDLFVKINFAKATKDQTSFYELIELLDCYLEPYKDERFREEVENVKISVKGRTMAEIESRKEAEKARAMVSLLKALMRLCWRKGLIPRGKTSQ